MKNKVKSMKLKLNENCAHAFTVFYVILSYYESFKVGELMLFRIVLFQLLLWFYIILDIVNMLSPLILFDLVVGSVKTIPFFVQ